LLKTFVDDESYNSGHGYAYEKYGIDVEEGAVVIVRPDQCKFHFCSSGQVTSLCVLTLCLDISLITALDDYKAIGDFFDGFALCQ
jgi:phenol 2-monooxygenase (NADPH)